MRTATGKVYLIGAGPGDIELLTLKAVRCLRLADVILLDALVNRAVLDFVREDSRVIEVGKRGGCKATPQEFIERLMIAEAKAGRVVARVKGGDPFVFGRGGEELRALMQAGIEVEVVAGITSGIAVPAALGIPVTHRDYTSGVVFVTGHGAREPNWKALAESGMTIVVYMGLGRVAKISSTLIESGLSPRTPAAVIQNGTLQGQRSVLADIGRLPDLVHRAGLDSPAIIIIGKVVSLACVDAIVEKRVAGTLRSQT